MISKLLDSYDLSEAVRFRMDHLAIDQTGVESWIEAVIGLDGHQIYTRSWEVIHRGKRIPKMALEIKCTGQITAEEIWCWIDRLTAFIKTQSAVGTVCVGFWLARIDCSCYDGRWTSTFVIGTQGKPIPPRYKELWRTHS